MNYIAYQQLLHFLSWAHQQRQLSQVEDMNRKCEEDDNLSNSLTTQEPRFHLTSNPKQLMTFGFVISRMFYNVKKNPDEIKLLISYTQMNDITTKATHLLTLGMSPHCKHHMFFLFDCAEDFHYANDCFPNEAMLKNLDSLIEALGPNYEFAMEKRVWHSNKLLYLKIN